MAKAKAKAKTKGKAAGKKAKPIVLPNGYKVIGRAPNWDMDKNPVVEGERGETRTVTFNEGTKKEESRECFIVNDEELGAVVVWNSTGLRDCFEQTEEGQTVRIEYLGQTKPTRKGYSGMKLFSVGVKD